MVEKIPGGTSVGAVLERVYPYRGIDTIAKKRRLKRIAFGQRRESRRRRARLVHPTQVGLWKKEILEGAKTLFEGKRGPKPVAAHQDPERLYGEIGKLKVELDWLKKSPASACHDATGSRAGTCR
jgi:hypothetical protein